jgi:hypothetical protein
VCKARRSSEPSDTGSVAATPSSPSSPRARRGDAKAMRAQLAMIGTLTHASPSSVTLARALARLRQRQVHRGSRSDACTARLSSEPTAASDARAIGTLSHSSPSSVTLAKGLCWLGCGNVKYNEALEAMRAQLGEHRNPVIHSSPSSVTLARALARLRQREARHRSSTRRC